MSMGMPCFVIFIALLLQSCYCSMLFSPSNSWEELLSTIIAEKNGGVQDYEGSGTHIPYFLRTYNVTGTNSIPLKLPAEYSWLEGVDHYRLLPGIFPDKMQYHFDGLATVMKFSIKNGLVTYFSKAYASPAFLDYKKCIFFGNGDGPTLGTKICFQNPGVNLLPIDGQLWLTIDTSSWGRVDPSTLETIEAKVNMPSTYKVLNAHPACTQDECFVQYPCPLNSTKVFVNSDQACFAKLLPGPGDISIKELSRTTMPKNKLIQHSHSPCVTQNYLVSKLDAFVLRNPLNSNAGLLKYVHQGEDNLWMVMDRHSNQSRIMSSNFAFVNNHFWNCYEQAGAVVVETVTATSDYLDNYFARNLDAPTPPVWKDLFHQPQRCFIPASGSNISCVSFMQDKSVLFDYPTFNPLYKMGAYRFFYAISPASNASRWFDRLVKVDHTSGAVVKAWSADGLFLTEFDFIPRATTKQQGLAEDDGVLVTVVHNATADSSSLALFDARELSLLGMYALAATVPFHAHGIVCRQGRCFSNP